MNEYHAIALASGFKPRVRAKSSAIILDLNISTLEVYSHNKSNFRMRTINLTNVLINYQRPLFLFLVCINFYYALRPIFSIVLKRSCKVIHVTYF